ncbi:MAG: hypothetical protein QXW55_03155 [Candidatus Bathyarchaeia archaeon]
MGNSFEEALSNIDVFCSVLVRKMMEDKEPQVEPEPIEKMLRKKCAVKVYGNYGWEEPLIDIFEDEKQLKILMRCPFKGQEIELRPNDDGVDVWVSKSQKIKLPIDPLNLNKTTIRWNSQFLEITVRK